LKQLIINGKAVGSIWKTEKPNAEPKHTEPKELKQKNTAKPEGSCRAAPFIPESYSDPTASVAMRNLLWEEKQREQEEQRMKRRANKGKKRRKTTK